jgi:hypothetical protein
VANYTVKLPDGNEYGPVDIDTLKLWRQEGRIGPDTWVWPDTSSDWVTLSDVLVPEVNPPALQLKPLDREEIKQRRDASRSVSGPLVAPAPSPDRRRFILIASAALAVAAVAIAVLALLLPGWQKKRAQTRMQEFALSDRQIAEPDLGLVLQLPVGWVALKAENPMFVGLDAKVRLGNPSLGALAALSVESHPPGGMSLDQFIDHVLDARRPLVSGLEEKGRADAALGSGRARRVDVAWSEGGDSLRASIVAWQDAWRYFALSVWGPAKEATRLASETDALAKGVGMTGVLAARVNEAVEALTPEAPELSRASLELLVKDRLGNGKSAEEVPETCMRDVSQGLPALSVDETAELAKIYEQVYAPIADGDRQRLAAYLGNIKAGRTVPPEESADLRKMLKDGIAALPDEPRLRLQALNEKAIAASLALK